MDNLLPPIKHVFEYCSSARTNSHLLVLQAIYNTFAHQGKYWYQFQVSAPH